MTYFPAHHNSFLSWLFPVKAETFCSLKEINALLPVQTFKRSENYSFQWTCQRWKRKFVTKSITRDGHINIKSWCKQNSQHFYFYTTIYEASGRFFPGAHSSESSQGKTSAHLSFTPRWNQWWSGKQKWRLNSQHLVQTRDGEASLTQMSSSTVTGGKAAPWGFQKIKIVFPLAVTAITQLPAAFD